MRRLSAFIAASLIAASAAASESRVGTSGAQFLKIGGTARATAMGDAYTAMSGDVGSAYYNPAGLATIERTQLTAMRTQWFQGLDYNYGAVALPASFGTFAFQATTLETDAIDRRGADETALGSFTNFDSAYALSFGTDISEAISAGLTARYIRQEIDTASAQSWGGDLGLQYANPDSRFSYGLAARNLGQKIKFVDEGDPQPLLVDFGAAGKFFEKRLTLSADVISPRDNDIQFGLGSEWLGGRQEGIRYAARAGFKTQGTDADGASGLTLGGGIGYRRLDFDVAWVPFGDLGNTFRYAVLFKF